ncbi:ABC transporter substrate-binding protein [Sedimentitalea sp. HM32M-2]|uniref:ABC transporter substrate-binding protein n=1 Tax=Sedimentitalea sp. HM32M-2 TaxID=3351566 RepID=UPI0036277BE3
MKTRTLPVAYMPLVDAAPLIVAQEMGFAQQEGLALDLIAAPSWSSIRDMLAFGRVDAAQLLSPMPVAMALGLGGVRTPVSAVSVLSVNGDVIGVGRRLERRLRETGFEFDFRDVHAAARALARCAGDRLVFGVPFPFSMQLHLLRYWFDGTALSALPIEIRTVPPPLMAKALAAEEIDAFCVGEPWGSVAVENGVGALLLPGSAIWAFAPEKVLAARTQWAETRPDLLGGLLRAVWKAGRWLSRPHTRVAAAAIMSRAGYLDVPADLIDRALDGRLIISGRGELRSVENFVTFHEGAAGFPWRSQAKWIAHRMSLTNDLPSRRAQDVAGAVFRSDLYRQHMQGTEADLPGASEKLEGSIRRETPVASQKGLLSLQPDAFFDGRIFDPYCSK